MCGFRMMLSLLGIRITEMFAKPEILRLVSKMSHESIIISCDVTGPLIWTRKFRQNRLHEPE